MVLYGWNKVFLAFGKSEYNMTSYGVSIGGNVDIKIGRKGNKLSAGLFVPFLSQKFKDNYEAAKNDPELNILFDIPVVFSVGYNFKLTK